jgi:hypothetical protein
MVIAFAPFLSLYLGCMEGESFKLSLHGYLDFGRQVCCFQLTICTLLLCVLK